MILTVILLVVLVAPTLAWLAIRYRPERDGRGEAQRSGPKHRWWQP